MSENENQENTVTNDGAPAAEVVENSAVAKPTEETAKTEDAAQQNKAADKPPIPEVHPAENKKLDDNVIDASQSDGKIGESLFDINKLNLLNDVSIVLSIEIGRAQIKIRDLLSLTKGAIIELDKLAGEPVDVYANGKLISTGNIITANGKYCVRLASINEKIKSGG